MQASHAHHNDNREWCNHVKQEPLEECGGDGEEGEEEGSEEGSSHDL